MKKSLLLFAAVACFSVALADNTQAVRKALDANYKAFTTDFQKQDTKAMLAMMTDDYTATQSGHTMSKAQIGQSMEQQVKVIKNATWVRKITSLKLVGKQAIAVVNGNFHGTVTGPDSKEHDFKLDAVTTDTWVKTPKGYKLQKSVVQKNTVTMDGQVMGQPG